MRNIQRMLCGLGLLTVAMVGCNGGSSAGGEPVATGQARIVLAAQGKGPAHMHLTATDDATSKIAFDKTVDVKAGSPVVLNAELKPASYTIHLDAFADVEATVVLGSVDAHLDLKAGLTTEIDLTADSDTSGKVDATIIAAPIIADIDVTAEVDGSLKIHVNAKDPAGEDLKFFWSGYGLDAAIEGSATLIIDADVAVDISLGAIVHLVVQNTDGVCAVVDIDLSAGVDADIDVNVDVDLKIQACLSLQAQCLLVCDADVTLDPTKLAVHAACVAACGLDFATCCGKP